MEVGAMSDLKYRRPQILDRIPLDQHALIEASAGTGKTYTIENLIVEILLKTDATIDRILVVTFTEKATSELRARIRTTLESVITGESAKDANDENAGTIHEDGIRKLREALFSIDRAPIQTIHSFCHRTLSELAFQTGSRFEVEVTDALSSFHEAFRAELREHIADDETASKLLAEWLAKHDSPASKAYLQLEKLLYDAHQKRYLLSEELARNAQLRLDQRAALSLEVRVTDALLPRIAARMEKHKREHGLLDYDDMLAWLARALDGDGGAALASTLRDRYHYALIDEFQDTDELQWKIFRRIFIEGEKNFIHLIGDPKQAIYSFRGADVFTYLAARRELIDRNATIVPLSANFRTTEKLIAAVNSILCQEAVPPFFTGAIRYESPVTCGGTNLRSTNDETDFVKPVTLLKLISPTALSASAARQAIGAHIAATIRAMLFAGSVKAKDIFILTRSNPESVQIGKNLREAGVPFDFYKQEGLFETREASDILDALRGVQEPERRSCRFKAWTTPFFTLPYASLANMAELASSHPLLERLYDWKSLADQERFAELFDAMLHQSGLVNRELFLSSSGRELTNYLHIFEILLEKAGARRLALGEVIELLSDYIVHRALPGGDDSDVLRIESERDAVQIMTVHKSKGLEAEVVFLFGGTHKGNSGGDVAVFHDDGERRVAIGKDARDAAKTSLRREESEEDERLMYVALTRARSKMYLPYFPDKSINKITGFYKHLNDRLKILENSNQSSALFEIEEVRPPDDDRSTDGSSLDVTLHDWEPPELLLDETHDDDARKTISKIGTCHAPLKTWSYTSIQHSRDAAEPFDAEEFRTAMDSLEARTGSVDLPGGRAVGVFLHEAIEKLDFESFGDAPDLKSWTAREDVRELFASTMRRCGVNDPRWMVRGPEVVFNALTSRIALGETVLERGLYRLPKVREMEFTYPIPEKNHRLLANGGDDGCVVERGYVKGFVDLVFQRDNSIYFADWKGDLLPSYDPGAVTLHVERHYSLQASIYALGIVRLLGIDTESDYNRRFGGLLYVFLRGVIPTGDGKSGLYFARPSWREIVSYESALMTTHVDDRSHI
jgi:exodeoxyribonuclease V beta subunit